MKSLFTRSVRHIRGLTLALAAGLLAACDPSALGNLGALGLGGGGKVQVALLLPKGSSRPGISGLSASAERAVLLAIADMGENADVDLRVYDTKGDAATTAGVTTQALAEGAQVIVGPLFAENAIAAGNVAGAAGVSVLALSNNVDVAGGNVFVLGNTFDSAARRLVSYAFQQGKKRAIIVHAKNIAGEAGRRAIEQALANVGAAPVGVEGYNFTPDAVIAAGGKVAAKSKATGADVVLLTADFGQGDLQLLGQTLPEACVNPATVQYAGITRWDSDAAARNLPGIQNGWFALPSPSKVAAFNGRYKGQYGFNPHPVATVAFDAMAAVGAVAASKRNPSFAPVAFMNSGGFQGANGIFRLMPDGTNQRSLAVGTIKGNQVIVLSPAPESFAGAGF